MTLYLNNSSALPSRGLWRYEGPLSIAAARRLIANGFVSAVGHAAAARYLSRLLGRTVPVRRRMLYTRPGDHILILAIGKRLPEGRILGVEDIEVLAPTLRLLTHLDVNANDETENDHVCR